MAVIVGEGVQRPLKSPLSLAPLDRAMDCLRLAQRGYRESQRVWNDFAAESPGLARVVVKAIQAENEEIAAATKRADKMLARGEAVMITKGATVPKPKKPKKVRKAAGSALLTKAGRDRAVMASIEADLRSPDPERRLLAFEILGRVA